MVRTTPPAESRRSARRAAELARRRSDVVKGAAEIFGAKGYDGAQMTEIAKAAEVSLGSLYGLFEGKDQIYRAVLEDAARHMEASVRQPIERIEDPAQALLELVDTLFHVFDQNANVLRLLLGGTGGLPAAIRSNLRGASAPGVDDFVSWLSEICDRAVRQGALRGLDAEALALTLTGALLQTAAHAIEHAPSVPLSENAPRVRAIFARTLGID